MLWGKRKGFARIAKEVGVPVFPMFTANIRESIPIKTSGIKGRSEPKTTRDYLLG